MDSSEIARTLAGVRVGDRDASDRLFQFLYGRLRSMGGALLVRERADHTLQPTALVHEAYLQLSDRSGGLAVEDRAHFLSIAANAMRRVLVEHARRHRAEKRGGGAARVTLTDGVVQQGGDVDLLELDDALDRLAAESPRAAQGVVLRFFGGLTTAETAEVQGVSVRTVGDDWTTSKLWLRRALS